VQHRSAAVAVALTVVLAAACSGGSEAADPTTASTTTVAETTTSEATTTTAASRTITWEQCDDAECGALTVPLDWSDPSGATIDLALVRVPAKEPAHRIGSLLVNPGGPGGSGVEFVRSGFEFDPDVADRFDLVGFDPRGVGGSDALECGDEVPAFLEADSGPDSPEEQADLDAKAKAVADECAAEDGDRLAHVGTIDVVRDMDAIRDALGDGGLTFYGFSYGTKLGVEYAALFPDRVRAIVLDGVVDPADDFESYLREQTVALEQTMTSVFAACDTDPSCPVSGGAAAAYDRVAAATEVAPLDAGSGHQLGPSEVATGALFVSYDKSLWRDLYDALADAEKGDGEGLYALADSYRSFGGYTVYAAVECADSPHPAGSPAFAAFASELAGLSPRFGAAVANELLPCAFWPVPPTGEPGDVLAPGAPAVLVIGNTGDAATPYRQAVEVAGNLESGVLLTYQGEGHTSYGKSPCVDNAVADYLIDLTPPAAGMTCK
jgi:pimeloyl-ACP methyl ester carboxylesterase